MGSASKTSVIGYFITRKKIDVEYFLEKDLNQSDNIYTNNTHGCITRMHIYYISSTGTQQLALACVKKKYNDKDTLVSLLFVVSVTSFYVFW